MQAVDDEIEIIHLYVVKEEAKKPPIVLPLFAALFCLTAIVGITIYSAYHPTYEHETLTIPAHFLPPQTFTATEQIIPTGSKTYPATTAHGVLTITNGSVIAQIIPKGFIVSNVATDNAVFVPAGSVDGYGVAIVQSHALQAGKQGNLQKMQINTVIGSSLYIRNLSPFTGGNDAHTVSYITPQDRQTAIDAARVSLTSQVAHRQAILANPCNELVDDAVNLVVKWTCQFVSYPKLPGMRITATRLLGKNLIVSVEFVARPTRVWMR